MGMLFLYISKQTLLWAGGSMRKGAGGRVTNGRRLTNRVTLVCVALGAFWPISLE